MLMGITPCLWGHIYKKVTHSAIFEIQSWKTFLCLLLQGMALKWVIGKDTDQMGPSHQYPSMLLVQPAFPSRFYPLFSLTFHQVCGTAQSLFVNYLVVWSRLLLLGVKSKILMDVPLWSIWFCHFSFLVQILIFICILHFCNNIKTKEI